MSAPSAAQSKIPEPPPISGMSAPSAPPSPMPGMSASPKVKAASSARGNLLDQIRNRKSKVSKDHIDKDGSRDFVYSNPRDIKISNISSENKETQMNALYSAMVDHKNKLVDSLKAHTSEVDSGRVDDWEEPIMEQEPTYSKKDLEYVEKAVTETIQRMKRGEDLPDISIKKASDNSSKKSLNDNKTKAKKVALPKKTVTQTPAFVATTDVNIAREGKTDLLSAIRAGRVLKKAKTSVSLDMDGFTYLKDKLKEKTTDMKREMIKRRGGVSSEDFQYQFEGMSDKEQLNTLYTAVIDNDKKKVSDISNFNLDDDHGFDDDEVEPNIRDRDITDICKAAMKVAMNQPSSKRVIIEKTVQSTYKKFDVKPPVTKSKPRSR